MGYLAPPLPEPPAELNSSASVPSLGQPSVLPPLTSSSEPGRAGALSPRSGGSSSLAPHPVEIYEHQSSLVMGVPGVAQTPRHPVRSVRSLPAMPRGDSSDAAVHLTEGRHALDVPRRQPNSSRGRQG